MSLVDHTMVAWADAYHHSRYPNVLVQWDEPAIYAFQAGHYVKIGWSSSVFTREYQLRKRQGKPLRTPEGARVELGRLIAAWPGTRKDEQPTHQALAEHRVIGEWFWHNEAVDNFIVDKLVRIHYRRARAVA